MLPSLHMLATGKGTYKQWSTWGWRMASGALSIAFNRKAAACNGVPLGTQPASQLGCLSAEKKYAVLPPS